MSKYLYSLRFFGPWFYLFPEVVILTKFGNFHYGIETKIWTASERFLENFWKKKFFLKIIPKTFPKQSYPNFYKSLDKNIIKKYTLNHKLVEALFGHTLLKRFHHCRLWKIWWEKVSFPWRILEFQLQIMWNCML